MNFEHTSPRRTLSKHDRNLRRNEMEESIEENVEAVEECELMFNDLDRVLEKYFPEEFKNFDRPEQWRYHRTYGAVLNLFYAESGWNKNADNYYNESAFLAVSAIRYIDDFIDETLWPSLGRAKKIHRNLRDVSMIFCRLRTEPLYCIYRICHRT